MPSELKYRTSAFSTHRLYLHPSFVVCTILAMHPVRFMENNKLTSWPYAFGQINNSPPHQSRKLEKVYVVTHPCACVLAIVIVVRLHHTYTFHSELSTSCALRFTNATQVSYRQSTFRAVPSDAILIDTFVRIML